MCKIITYEELKEIVEGKLVNKTLKTPYEDLSERIFGEGNCFNESEVRKRMYGMKRVIEILENETDTLVHTRILSISDLHFPFSKDIQIFEKYKNKVDILQINGDLLDHQGLSKFPKLFRVSPIEEIIGARQLVLDLVDLIKPKKLVVNYGNHELRLGMYLAKKLNNELQELIPPTAFDYIFNDGFCHYDHKSGTKTNYRPLQEVLKDIEIEYSGTWYSQIGSVVFAHPKYFSSSPMKTAEKALYWFRNEGYRFRNMNTLVMAHTHRLGQYKIGDTTIYEQGCCCDTSKMLYADGNLTNSQKEGFLYLCLDEFGDVIDDKSKLVSLN